MPKDDEEEQNSEIRIQIAKVFKRPEKTRKKKHKFNFFNTCKHRFYYKKIKKIVYRILWHGPKPHIQILHCI